MSEPELNDSNESDVPERNYKFIRTGMLLGAVGGTLFYAFQSKDYIHAGEVVSAVQILGSQAIGAFAGAEVAIIPLIVHDIRESRAEAEAAQQQEQ
jgi:hypothetical protein